MRILKFLYIFTIGILLSAIAVAQPIANFTSKEDSGCGNLAVAFSDLSTGNPVKWSWSFGDGNSSSLQNPSTFYSIPGSYTVALTVTDGNGNKNTITKTNFITVHKLPTPQFASDVSSGCVPLIVNFTDQSILGSAPLESWLWDFGDGSFSASQNPTHTFASIGTYQVSLEVTDTLGCSKEKVVSSYLSVLGLPSVSFSSSATEACAVPFTVNYTNASDTGLIFLWDFGTAGTSTQTNPSKTFSTLGTYSVYLTGTNATGCSSTYGPALVNIIPFEANFSLSSSTPCLNSQLTFSDQSLLYANSWLWNFGDISASSTQQNPTHTYATTGNFTVTLTSGSSLGCSDTQTKTVTVYPLPDINFSVTDSTTCDTPFVVTFTDNTGGAVDWQWDIDHPDTSVIDTFIVDYTSQFFTHSYDTTSIFTVKLMVTDSNGCTDTTTKNNFITSKLPYVSISSNKSSGCIPLTIAFKDTSWSNEPIVSWSWDFGDPTSGSNNSSSLPNPSHTYNDTGIYTVTLTFIDAGGCTKSGQYGVQAGVPPIIYGIDILDTAICFAGSLSILDSSSSYTDDGEWLYTVDLDSGKWSWYPPNSTFPFNIDYFVSTWTLDTGYVSIAHIDYHNGCPSDTAFYPKLFSVSVPMATWTLFNDIICEKDTPWTNQPFILEEVYVDHYLWDFGDSAASGLANYSSDKNPAPHVYTSAGQYVISLIISNDSTACSYSQTKNMFISDIDVSIALDTSALFGCNPSTFTFHNTSTSNNDVYAWAWLFGDSPTPASWYDINANFMYLPFNATYYLTNYDIAYWDYAELFFATSPTDSAFIPLNDTAYYTADSLLYSGTYLDPFHTYDSSGVYSVRLVVKDAYGCTDSMTLNNVVTIYQHPNSLYSQDIKSGCAPLSISFTDTTLVGAAPLSSWYWNYGDGSTDSIQNPSHTFIPPGVFPVTLTVTDTNNCSTSITKASEVIVTKPFPSISYPINDCYYNNTLFNNTSVGANLSYTWNFGDGSPIDTVSVSPYHQFNVDSNESFTISLYAVDTNGCDSLFIQTINIFKPRAGYFLTDQKNNCPPFFASFIDTGSSSISTWTYNFGDGSSASLSSILDADTVSHVYSMSGAYDVSLIVTDAAACKDTLQLSGYVQVDGPLGTFDYTPKDGGCPPIDVTFTPNNVSNAASYLWIFGDGGSSNIEDTLTHTYSQAGYFTPVLILEDSINYAIGDSISCIFTIIPDSSLLISGPQVDFDFTGADTSCTPYSVNFTNFTNPDSIDVWLWNFGDTINSTDMNPMHYFSDTGTYSVTLTGIVYNSNDTCVYSLTKDKLITVIDPPQVNYSLSDVDSCPPLAVQFLVNNSSLTYSVSSYNWNFGDGESSTEQNPLHIYDNSGSFPVSLDISYFNGCEATYPYNSIVEIYPDPTADFVINPEINGTSLKYLYFNNMSTLGDSYIWDFGDGTGSAEQFPKHQYTLEGQYQIQLIVLNDYGCTDTAYQSQYFYSKPELSNSFTPNGDGINDYFILQITGYIEDLQLKVFSRWGKEVYDEENYNNEWDGKDKDGKLLPADTYYFILNYQSKTVWAGWLRIFY